MPSEPPSALLDRVRKLLAKAEAEGVTPPEAEALTAKAAELMARYGIDRARLAAARPDTDRPDSRIIDIDNPWAQVRAHLLAGLAGAMRCQCVILHTSRPGTRIHVFGYASDLERADILYTSLLLQMAHGLTAAVVPTGARSPRAWRRSWLLGFVSAVIARVRSAEDRAATAAEGEPRAGPRGPGGRHPQAARAGLPRYAEDADHLQRPGLQRRLRPGPAGRHRERPARADQGAYSRLSRARKIASVPCRCGQNWANRGSGARRPGTSARTAGASRIVTSPRWSATAVTTSRVSATCGEQVT